MKKLLYKTRLIIAGVVIFVTTLALLGIYPVHFLNVQFSALLQRSISDYCLFAVILLAALLLFTLLFGRFYCSTLCPLGIMQELANLIYNKAKGNKLPEIDYIKPTPYKYFIMALTFGAIIGGSVLFIKSKFSDNL